MESGLIQVLASHRLAKSIIASVYRQKLALYRR